MDFRFIGVEYLPCTDQCNEARALLWSLPNRNKEHLHRDEGGALRTGQSCLHLV